MTVGGEEVLSERELLAGVEDGLMMDSTDSVRYIILHCSATRCDRDYTVEQLLHDHRARGFRTIGYHFYGAPSACATRADWMPKGIPPTRSPRNRPTGWNVCC